MKKNMKFAKFCQIPLRARIHGKEMKFMKKREICEKPKFMKKNVKFIEKNVKFMENIVKFMKKIWNSWKKR